MFGGDTYISRYRLEPSQNYGHSWFRASADLGDAGPNGENSNEEYEVIAHPDGVGFSKNTSRKMYQISCRSMTLELHGVLHLVCRYEWT